MMEVKKLRMVFNTNDQGTLAIDVPNPREELTLVVDVQNGANQIIPVLMTTKGVKANDLKRALIITTKEEELK